MELDAARTGLAPNEEVETYEDETNFGFEEDDEDDESPEVTAAKLPVPVVVVPRVPSKTPQDKSSKDKNKAIAGGDAVAEHSTADTPGHVKLQFLSTHDWHATIDNIGKVGGAAVLSAYWNVDEGHYPKGHTLRFTSGDSYGATPPLVSVFNETPAIITERLLGMSADTFGNHNFDKGYEHVAEMTRLSATTDASVPGKPFRAVISNMEGASKLLPETREYVILNAGGVKVGVVGIIGPEAYKDQQPKNWGPLKILNPVTSAMAVQKKALAAGADLVVCLVHMGMDKKASKVPKGLLLDFARNVSGFAVIFGDHTGIQWSSLDVNGQIVLETLRNGESYARTRITWDTKNKKIAAKSVQFVVPTVGGVEPDAKVLLMLDGFRAKLAPIYSRVLGYSPMFFTRDKNCKPGLKCETVQGNLISDAMLSGYPKAVFAYTNTGGIRSGFACNEPGGAGFCPVNQTGNAPFAITVGTCRGVLPFTQTMVTAKISGQTLRKTMELMLKDDFPQIAGFCFTYTGSKVTGAVFSDKGKCTTRHVNLDTAENIYGIVTTEYMGTRDNFPDLRTMPEYKTEKELRDVVQDYIARPGFQMPAIGGRIVCSGADCSIPSNPTKWN